MIDFIKRNKIFSGCLVFLLVVITSLTGILIYEKISGDEDLKLPSIFNPDPDSMKDPEIISFTGSFDDELNQIRFTWDYELYRHKLNYVEIYHDKVMMNQLNDEKNTLISITAYGISTGNNDFELRLYYDNGMVVSKTINVFIDYVFDVEMNHQLIDNNIGKGYLFSIKYHYNAKTPVGIPKILVNTTFSKYWGAKYLNRVSKPLKDDYLEITAYYFIDFKDYPEEEVTWNLSYTFESVGVRLHDTFSEVITPDKFVTDKIEVNQP